MYPSNKDLRAPSKLEVELRELSHEDLIGFSLWCAATNRPMATSSLSVWQRGRVESGASHPLIGNDPDAGNRAEQVSIAMEALARALSICKELERSRAALIRRERRERLARERCRYSEPFQSAKGGE